MKKLLLRFSESYFETFRFTRLLSQLFAFYVGVALTINVVDTIYFFTISDAPSPEIRQYLIKQLSITAFTAFLFVGRFALLFFRKAPFFWLSQFFWLFTYLFLYSQISNSGCTKNAFPEFGEHFSYIFVLYIIFSPLRQLLTLLASFGRLFVKS